MAVYSIAAAGSSPLARGLLASNGVKGYDKRIIPARAGFTIALLAVFVAVTDHPRSRGVYVARGRQFRTANGSSPLARGLLLRHGPARRQAGIIPARAGFTAWSREAARESPDHPRSRGVYRGPPPHPRPALGSSPLARGLHGSKAGDGSFNRIIPARAGFTDRRGDRFYAVKDHPRSRGVYASGARRARRDHGSSPLARGLRKWVIWGWPLNGIIPARAGFT